MPESKKSSGRDLWLYLEENYKGTPQIEKDIIETKVLSAKQYEDESVHNWIARLEALSNDRYIAIGKPFKDDIMKTKIFTSSNLKNQIHIQMHLDATDYRTLKAKLLDAKAFRNESYIQQTRSTHNQTNERIIKTMEKSSPLCFKCGERGHKH